MTKTTTIVGILTGFTLGIATHAGAQTAPAPLEQGYVNINVGAQPATRTFATAATIPIYGEQATFDAVHHIGNGPIFDVNGGVRIRPDFAVGAGFSKVTIDKDASAVHTSVPSPLIINSPQVQTQTVPDLKHSENAFYVQAVYFVPMTEKIDLALSAGPAFFHVKQDLISGIDIPRGTQAAAPIVATQSKTAVGALVGVDGSYLFTPRIGAGIFLRYLGAKAALASAPDLKVGGFQAGVGARVRF